MSGKFLGVDEEENKHFPIGKLTNEDIDWLQEMCDVVDDDGYSLSVNQKLEVLRTK